MTRATPRSSSGSAAPRATVSLQQVLDTAQALRREARFSDAIPLYQRLLDVMPGSTQAAVRAAVHHNLAVCLLAVGELDRCCEQARLAFDLDGRLWQSGVIEVNALKRLGRTADYVDRTIRLFERHGSEAEVAVAAANVTMNYLGDAVSARAIVQPFIEHPSQGREARTLSLMSRLYDRDADDSPRAISDDIRQLAARDLQLDAASLVTATNGFAAELEALIGSIPRKQRHRIGVLSPMLSASPVHAFCFSRFEALHAQGKELVFIQRGRTEDWATAEFQSIATSWVKAVDLEPEKLHLVLKALQLDELYEMGGWMDTAGLQAVSVKPAPRMLKWVGGQSCTTGLTVFDGFISDAQQSPPETAGLYSEPLILEPAAYVSYRPPPYLQAFRGKARKGSGRWGVISNPVKLSRSFLAWLAQLGASDTVMVLPHGQSQPVELVQLVLADHRYANPRVRQRVESVLRPVWGDRLHFEAPKGHVAFIDLLAALDGLFDTFPYSCGLTMAEALHVGLDVCFPDVPRQLFCERHGLAHVLNHHGNPPARAAHENG